MQAFMPLDDEVAEGGSLYGLSAIGYRSRYLVADDTDGQAHVYGISAQHLYGFISQGADTRDLYITCTSFTKNEEYALKAIAWLSEQTQEERPCLVGQPGIRNRRKCTGVPPRNRLICKKCN